MQTHKTNFQLVDRCMIAICCSSMKHLPIQERQAIYSPNQAEYILPLMSMLPLAFYKKFTFTFVIKIIGGGGFRGNYELELGF